MAMLAVMADSRVDTDAVVTHTQRKILAISEFNVERKVEATATGPQGG